MRARPRLSFLPLALIAGTLFAPATLAALICLNVATARADSAPTPAIEPPTAIGFSSAQLSGTVNPNGGPSSTAWYFQYLLKSEKEAGEESWTYANFEFLSEEESTKSEALPVAATLSGLAPGTVYLVRLGASNEGGEHFSTTREFETRTANSPLVTINDPTGVTTSGAHLSGTVNSNGAGEGETELRYHFQCSPECPGIEAPLEAPADSADHTVEADAIGLEPHREYSVVLVATNLATARAESPPATFTTGAVAPTVFTATNTPTGEGSAQVRAYVNSHNSELTDCQFLYGPTASYGAAAPCNELPGPTNSPAPLSAGIGGLAPGSTYHFAVVASSPGGTVQSGDSTFTTYPASSAAPCANEQTRLQQGSTDLPLCMAYELVSPADQLGADIDFGAGSADGDHAWVASTIPIAPDASTGNLSSLVATRTDGGWVQRDLGDAAVPGNNSFQLLARAPDSSATLVQSCPAILISCDKFVRFERIGADGSRSLIFEVAPISTEEGPPSVSAVSSDLSTAFLETFTGRNLLPEDTHTAGRGLYLAHQGQLEFIGRDGTGAVLECGAALANGRGGTGFEQNGASADGSTVFFESPDPESGCPQPVDIYLRRGGRSLDISAPRAGNPAYGDGRPDEGATFLGASRDGGVVYFLTSTQLDTENDTDAFADIYRYDALSDSVTRITPGAEVRQAVVSPAGDYVYFKALNAISGRGTDGQRNLYVYHAGEIRFIASADDGENFTLGGAMNSANASPLTPDGQHLLFRSASAFTGQPLGGTEQLFQYGWADNSLTCVSCPPVGPPSNSIGEFLATPTGNAGQRRQSDDGLTVAFTALDRLLPRDVNSADDVYLWHEGRLSLISSGRALRGSQLVSTDSAGHNVFFTSSDRLAPEVQQDNVKLYDARAGGGFLAIESPTACDGDACRGKLAPPAAAPTPGSAILVAPRARRHRRRHGHHRHRRAKHGHRLHLTGHPKRTTK